MTKCHLISGRESTCRELIASFHSLENSCLWLNTLFSSEFPFILGSRGFLPWLLSRGGRTSAFLGLPVWKIIKREREKGRECLNACRAHESNCFIIRLLGKELGFAEGRQPSEEHTFKQMDGLPFGISSRSLGNGFPPTSGLCAAHVGWFSEAGSLVDAALLRCWKKEPQVCTEKETAGKWRSAEDLRFESAAKFCCNTEVKVMKVSLCMIEYEY